MEAKTVSETLNINSILTLMSLKASLDAFTVRALNDMCCGCCCYCYCLWSCIAQGVSYTTTIIKILYISHLIYNHF
jgi:hypothetical protein